MYVHIQAIFRAHPVPTLLYHTCVGGIMHFFVSFVSAHARAGRFLKTKKTILFYSPAVRERVTSRHLYAATESVFDEYSMQCGTHPLKHSQNRFAVMQSHCRVHRRFRFDVYYIFIFSNFYGYFIFLFLTVAVYFRYPLSPKTFKISPASRPRDLFAIFEKDCGRDGSLKN